MATEPIVRVGDLKKALEKVPDDYEVVGSIMNCISNIGAVIVCRNDPVVILRDRRPAGTSADLVMYPQ